MAAVIYLLIGGFCCFLLTVRFNRARFMRY